MQKDKQFHLLSLQRKAAEKGEALAQFILGTCYLNGNGVEKDEKEAFQWFLKAAEQGYAQAQYNVGLCYLNGGGVEKKSKKVGLLLDVYNAVSQVCDSTGDVSILLFWRYLYFVQPHKVSTSVGFKPVTLAIILKNVAYCVTLKGRPKGTSQLL